SSDLSLRARTCGARSSGTTAATGATAARSTARRPESAGEVLLDEPHARGIDGSRRRAGAPHLARGQHDELLAAPRDGARETVRVLPPLQRAVARRGVRAVPAHPGR